MLEEKPLPVVEASGPPLPPKLIPPPLSSLPSLAVDHSVLTLPVTPTTPSSPSDAKQRKPNPLLDLIDSEKAYVDQLTGIIRKVAAAWSRSNLPPPDLDTMFRSIEAVYKASRAFHAKLKEIGANPSSPKALGDLLMRWIDDLQGPYTTYCTKYRCGFDIWEPIQSNPKLAMILATFSASNPPPPSAVSSNATVPPIWTLDDLFLLPKARIRYYRKLYSRLMKSTVPGKSDHKLLVGALETLDQLQNTLETRSSIKVGEASPATPPAPPPLPPLPHDEPEEVVIDLRTQSVIQLQDKQNDNPRLSADTHAGSESSSTRDSSVSGGERFSRETTSTSVSRTSSSTLSMPISDLERRLSTERTLDIFTMKPKVVRLQMAPPSLTFTREMRTSVNVVIRFTPQSTGVEVVHTLGHVFLLSDLFLVSERMLPQDRKQQGPDAPDMWLLYPPLAGKVLRVFDIPEQPRVLRVMIMRKETLFLEAESAEARNSIISHFRECIEFSQSLPPPSKVPPPPVPSLNGINRGPAPPPKRSSSPPQTSPPPYRDDGGAADSMVKRVLSPDAQRRVPSIQAGPMYPRTLPSGPNGQISGPVPVQGSMRSTSFGSPAPPRPGSGPPGPPNPPGPAPGPGSIFPSAGPGSSQINGPVPVQGPMRTTSFGSPAPPQPGSGPPNPAPGSILPGAGPGSIFGGPGPGPSRGGPDFGPGRGRGVSDFGPGSGRGGPDFGPGRGRGVSDFGPGSGRGGPDFGPGPGPGGPSLGPGPGIFHPHSQGGPNGPPPFPPGPNQPFPPNRASPNGLPPLPPNAYPPPRPPSEPGFQGGPQLAMRKSPSGHSLASQYSHLEQNQGPVPPPMPPFSSGHSPNFNNLLPKNSSHSSLPSPQSRLLLPSLQPSSRSVSMAEPSFDEPSPPNSPVQETPQHLGPVTSTISAQMKCKVFLQQQHSQWKSLGSAKLKLYRQDPTNVKQLVVEGDKSVIISTIVLTDGVERVGKTGVAIELSDKGQRTGIIYMIQLRNESAAGGLFDSLLQGSDRVKRG